MKYRKGPARRQRPSRQRQRAKRKSASQILEQLEPRILLARDVSGVIDSDDTWSGTIHAKGDVTIAEGVTLTIEPGTVVKSDVAVFLSAVGTIDARATAESPIIFTSSQKSATQT